VAGQNDPRPPPQSWAKRAYNITRWTQLPKGGHFAAMEVPEIYVADVRDWARGA
jgi:pimeloyl-ACP methyl ester carboxylesterase